MATNKTNINKQDRLYVSVISPLIRCLCDEQSSLFCPNTNDFSKDKVFLTFGANLLIRFVS